MTGFQITSGKGFHLTFPNGVTLSTQIGGGNYCSNRDYPITPMPYTDKNYLKNIMELPPSSNCEIMVWIGEGDDQKTLTRKITKRTCKMACGDDDVIGYVGFEDWLKIVNWCKNYKSTGGK